MPTFLAGAFPGLSSPKEKSAMIRLKYLGETWMSLSLITK